jgi:hypothetical protein
MSELSQFLIAAGFGLFCFGCGYFVGFIVTSSEWRNEMIKRGVARKNRKSGKWEWGKPPKPSRLRKNATVNGGGQGAQPVAEQPQWDAPLLPVK